MSNMEQAQKEYEEVIQWVLNEEDKVVERLNSEGRYVGGLDNNSVDFAYVYKERSKKIEGIKKKYNLN